MGLQPGDPVDPSELPPEPAAQAADPAADPAAAAAAAVAQSSRWRRWAVGGTLAAVAAGVLAVALSLTLGGGTPRGQRSAQAAAGRFLAAVDRHDGTAAAAVSCSTFAGQARAIAHSAAQGFRFRLGPVHRYSGTDASVPLTQTLRFPGGLTQHSTRDLELQAGSGRWLVCGYGS